MDWYKRARKNLWALPIALSLLTLAGLFLALLTTGLWHGVAWAMLTLPIGITGWYAFAGRS
ncbi:hypothetical protein [Amantichitinum ursilacus]|uniref:Uncharacterized protein n=1 Tax=Amantichitinum ursilacus TaxID=857265 RepID=A0A0N0GPW7_9NEIS|nr:hypothetical protein [Amantichitinum ursilacus]KPC54184.1 hypothetical protein WG78_06025 [Amantichitinum ursilacus]